MARLQRCSSFCAATTLVVLILGMAAGLLWFQLQRQLTILLDQQRAMAEQSVQSASRQITSHLQERWHLAQLAAENHLPELTELARNGGQDGAGHAQLMQSITRYLPELRLFTVADTVGRSLTYRSDEFIGPACQADLRRYTAAPQPHEVFVHDNPLIGKHIDILSELPAADGSQAAFIMYALDADPLQRILDGSQLPGHRLLLARSDRPELLDLSGAAWTGVNEEQAGEPLATARIPGSFWQIEDVLNPRMMANHRQALATNAVTLWLLFVLVCAPLLVVISRSERLRDSREALLRRANVDLSEQVDQTSQALDASQRELDRQTRTDLLTGLPNRESFEAGLAEVQREIRSTNTPGFLLYIDLDQFKILNETAGHGVGDLALRRVSERLLSRLRPKDLAARLSGDEFAVVRAGERLEDTEAWAESLRRDIARMEFEHAGRTYHLSATIGLVPLDAESPAGTELLGLAEMSCYLAKEKGRNRIHLWDSSDPQMLLRRGQMFWTTEIRDAISGGRLQLFRQRIAAIDGSESDWHEVLVRMWDRNGSLVPTQHLIEAAEQYGRIVEIDHWVLDKAIEWLAHPDRSGVRLNVNLSGKSISAPETIALVAAKLSHLNIEPRRLCLEITETAAAADLSTARRFIELAHRIGCSVALDDFGTGLSSLASLKELSCDYIKIDGSFIRQVDSDEVDRKIVEAIQAVARTLRRHTIAEFVESSQVLETLRTLGVDYAQGYHIDRPQPL